jgi:hypothetical protein
MDDQKRRILVRGIPRYAQIVFGFGVLCLLTLLLFLLRKTTIAAEVLLYFSIAAYFFYLLSSASLAQLNIYRSPWSWTKVSFALLLPATLIISWLPITVAWPAALLTLSPTLRQFACCLNNISLSYMLAWALYGAFTRLVPARTRLISYTFAVIIPVLIWSIEVGIGLKLRE